MKPHDTEKAWKGRGLSTRAARCLADSRVSSIEQLVDQTDAELLRIPGFGARCLSEVHALLAEEGYDRAYLERRAAVRKRLTSAINEIMSLVEKQTWLMARQPSGIEQRTQWQLDAWACNDKLEAEKRKLLDFVWENTK